MDSGESLLKMVYDGEFHLLEPFTRFHCIFPCVDNMTVGELRAAIEEELRYDSYYIAVYLCYVTNAARSGQITLKSPNHSY